MTRPFRFIGGPLAGKVRAYGAPLAGMRDGHGNRISRSRYTPYYGLVRSSAAYQWRPPTFGATTPTLRREPCPNCAGDMLRRAGDTHFYDCTQCRAFMSACQGCGDPAPELRDADADGRPYRLCRTCRAGDFAHLYDNQGAPVRSE